MLAALFIKRMSDVQRVEKVLPDARDPKSKVRAIGSQPKNCPQATILSVEGALFFGAARKFEREVLEELCDIRTLILRMGRVPMIDLIRQARKPYARYGSGVRLAISHDYLADFRSAPGCSGIHGSTQTDWQRALLPADRARYRHSHRTHGREALQLLSPLFFWRMRRPQVPRGTRVPSDEGAVLA
jgi:MFS superfamily sulfate permease-like transporter